MLLKRGVKPEELPVEVDVKKLQRKLENEEKEVGEDVKKKRR